MLKKHLFNTLAILIVVLAFTGCSSNSKIAAPTPMRDNNILPTKSVTTYPAVTIPSWLPYLPDGEYSIGIAWDKPGKPRSVQKSALEFATASLALNHGSYSVDKNSVIAFMDKPGSDTLFADYDVVLATKDTNKQRVKDKIKNLAETPYLGYKLFLYGYDNPKLYNEYVQASVANLPSWCKGNYQYEENGYIYTVGYAQHASLITAWKKAQEDGLRKLAQYRYKKIRHELIATTDITKKTILLDKVSTTSDAVINKTWLFQRTVDKVSDFNVFILLKTKI